MKARIDAILGISEFITFLGGDLEDENLIQTPDRVVKAWKNELCAGYDQDPEEILKTTFTAPSDEMVILKDIEFYSLCSHHLLPFHGQCSIGYIPKDRVVGISKLARLLECFSRRLQLQERMTAQIADSIMEHLKPHGCFVTASAQHLCTTSRGIQKQNSKMVTSAVRGCFKEHLSTRMEFLSFIQSGN
jgi:GTP cyclohydrolase I